MVAKVKLGSTLKIFLRSLIFYGIWLVPLITFYVWHWHNLKSFFNALENSPWQFIFMAFGWWFLAWVTMYALQTIWPVLLLIFYGTERERSPKKIITIGDRFRKMSLSTPQIYGLKEKSRFWSNKIWGFYSLPSPLGALLLLDEDLLLKMPPEHLDLWICRQVIESRFSRFSSVRFQFFALVPTLTLIGAFFGSAVSKMDPEITALVSIIFLLISVFIWRALQIQRMREIDRKTIHDFHLDAKPFFDSLAEAEKLSPTFQVFRKFLAIDFFQRLQKYEDRNWFRAWYTWAVPPAFIGLLLIAFVIQTPLKEMSLVMQAGLNQPKHPSSSAPVVVATTTPTSSPTATVATSPVSAAPAQVPPPSTTPLSDMSQAVYSGDWRAIIHQISLGRSLHEGDPALSGATPLMLAAKKGDLDMVYFLLAVGSNPSIESDQTGRSVLFYALDSDQRTQVVSYILRTRVDINKKANDGLTAIDYAKKNGWLDVVELLSSRGVASEKAPTANDKTTTK